MLLVDAVEERANVTMLAKDTVGQLHGFLGGHRILTFTQKKARSDPTYRFGAEPVRSRTQSGATEASTNATSLRSHSHAVDGWALPPAWCRDLVCTPGRGRDDPGVRLVFLPPLRTFDTTTAFVLGLSLVMSVSVGAVATEAGRRAVAFWWEVVGQCGDAAELMEILGQQRPDVVVVDIPVLAFLDAC
jgi:hypothetical protein